MAENIKNQMAAAFAKAKEDGGRKIAISAENAEGNSGHLLALQPSRARSPRQLFLQAFA